LLIQPPISGNELYKRGSQATASIIPPLGLASIAAVLEKSGHSVEIIDGIASNISLEETVAKATNFDFVGITVLSAFFKRCVEVVKAIKSAAGIPVIAGGAHATAMPGSLLESGVDYVVIGEGEETARELVAALVTKSHATIDKVKGIAFLRNNKMVVTERRPRVKNLDDLPMPARHLLPMDKYKTSEGRTHRNPCHSLVVSRGCKGNCTFCFKGAFGTEFRCRSAERIVQEMSELKDRYMAKEVAFLDDNFTTDRDRVIDVCRLLMEENFGIPWSCEARIDAVDEEMLRMMKWAGCEFIAYGIESGSDRILQSINKRIDTRTITKIIRKTQEIGISIRGYFMLGFVGETEAEMLETIRFATFLDPDIATFSLLIPFPGTTDYIRAQKEGGSFDPLFFQKKIVPEFNFLDDPIYCPKDISPQRLLEIHREAYRKFYYRPSFLMRAIGKIRNFHDLKRLLQGAKTLLQS
jgi:radical SAM superfamily enzyme YgiQ (UPF0313 family)